MTHDIAYQNEIAVRCPANLMTGPSDWLTQLLKEAWRVSEGVRELLQDKAYTELVNNRDAIIRAALSLFDEFIEPIDIPVIPDFLEATVDATIRSQLEVALNWAFDQVLADKEDENE